MKKLRLITILLAVSVTLATSGDNCLCFSQNVPPLGTAEQKEEVPNKAQLKEWIRQLGNPSFRKREQASEKLKNCGLPAAAALLKAVASDDLEIALRAKQLLTHLVQAHNPPAEDVPLKTLHLLALGKSPNLSRWAFKAIAHRYKECDLKTQRKLEMTVLKSLCETGNKEIATMVQHLIYDQYRTRALLKNILDCKREIESHKSQIKELEKAETDRVRRTTGIQDHQNEIRALESRIRRYESELHRHQLQMKKQ